MLKIKQKLLQKLVLTFVASAFAAGVLAQPAQAIKQFSVEFMKLYDVDKESEQKSDFAKTVLKAKCYVCHQGKKKKHHNRYGAELVKLLDKKKDKKNPRKIIEALEKVAKMHTDVKDKKSPTYGDLIKASKLPGGPLAEVKKEPKNSGKKGSAKKDGSDKK